MNKYFYFQLSFIYIYISIPNNCTAIFLSTCLSNKVTNFDIGMQPKMSEHLEKNAGKILKFE